MGGEGGDGCEHLDRPYRKLLTERDALRTRVDNMTTVMGALVDLVDGMSRPCTELEYVRDRIFAALAEGTSHDR